MSHVVPSIGGGRGELAAGEIYCQSPLIRALMHELELLREREHTANNYCQTTAQLRCYVSHTSLTVLRAADGCTEYCQTRAVVSSAALSTAKLVWET